MSTCGSTTRNLGKLSMGHGSIAGDAGGLYDLSGVGYVYGFAGANGTDGTLADASVKVGHRRRQRLSHGHNGRRRARTRGFRPFNFFGARENRIRYDTPSLMGARVGLSYNENKGLVGRPDLCRRASGGEELHRPVRLGLSQECDDGSSAWALSGGIKHNSSGFNVNGSYDTDGEESDKGFQNSQWGVTLGWSGKINDNGATAIGVGFNRSSDGMQTASASQYWLAIVQKIDAAAADVYAGVSYRQRLGDAYGDVRPKR